MTMNGRESAPTTPSREIYCPKCRRVLGERGRDAVITGGVRIYCRTCRRMVWVDESAEWRYKRERVA